MFALLAKLLFSNVKKNSVASGVKVRFGHLPCDGYTSEWGGRGTLPETYKHPSCIITNIM